MIELYSPRGEMELLLLRSILDDAGILYYVHNDTFGSLYSGRYAEAYNRKTIYVPEVHLAESRVLMREFLERTGQAGRVDETQAPPRLVVLLHQLLEEAARRWPPHRRGPVARRIWQRLDAWGWTVERGDPRHRGFHLIRNDSPRPAVRDSGGRGDDSRGDDGGGAPPLRLV